MPKNYVLELLLFAETIAALLQLIAFITNIGSFMLFSKK